MRAIVLPLCIVLFGLVGTRADARDPTIPQVIQKQIEAFLADDSETAFTYASPAIQDMFRTARNFGTMVRQGYPMVWRPGEVRYLDQVARGSSVYQRVLITDQDGVPHLLEYQMVPGNDGWRINGVRLMQGSALGV